LNAAVSEAFQRWLMPLVELASRPGPATPLERLGMGLRECLGSLEANREIVVAFFEALAQVERAPGLRQRMADSYAEFRQTIAATVRGAFGEAGEEAGVNSEAVASVIMAVFDGLLLQWSLDPDRVPDADELLRSTSIAALLAARPA
jgi:hypothetical protein